MDYPPGGGVHGRHAYVDAMLACEAEPMLTWGVLIGGQAYVDGTLACEAELMLVLAKDKK
eukprot:8367289-Pyramimonas_sp.AAC.1